jgi:hypothetical protein
MSMPRKRARLSFDALEERLALSAAWISPPAPSAVAAAEAGVPASVTIAVLDAFAKTYLSRVGDSNYNPVFDLNHNGQIGQTDAKLLLRALPAVSPKVPIAISLTLAPQDRPKGPVPKNSGGVTHSKTPTILGHTSPGALIFVGTGTTDLKLAGPVLVANAQGNFSFTDNLTAGINQLDFQAVDRYGQQILRAYPIYWLNFGQYASAHPVND